MLGKQTVDILSTLGRHFPYHFFVFSADTDNIFFHLCSESKLSTFCRHSVDIFPIISLYFLRTLSIFFFICARKANCRHFVDTRSTFSLSFLCIFCGHCQHFFFHLCSGSKLSTTVFSDTVCALKANCRHFGRSTFSLSFLCIFCGHCQHFFSFVLGKQTVDILSTLGRHFPYHFFVFSADTDNIFFHLCSESKLSTFCRHSVDIFPIISLYFLRTLTIFFFHLCSESKLSTFCRHSVDIFPIISLYFLRTLTIFFFICALKANCRHFDIFPIISLYFLRTLTTFFFICALKANCRHFVDTRSTFSLSFLCIFCGHWQYFFSFVLWKQTVDILSTLGRHFPYHFFVFSADTDNIFFHLCSESKLSTFCRHSVDIFPIISLYFLRTLTIFFFICALKANCRHFVDTRSTFSLSFLCIFCGHWQYFFSFVLGKANCRHFVDTRSTLSLSFLCIFCGHWQYFFSFVLWKQTVDILSTLGRHFPYHFFVFSADTVNTFYLFGCSYGSGRGSITGWCWWFWLLFYNIEHISLKGDTERAMERGERSWEQ